MGLPCHPPLPAPPRPHPHTCEGTTHPHPSPLTGAPAWADPCPPQPQPQWYRRTTALGAHAHGTTRPFDSTFILLSRVPRVPTPMTPHTHSIVHPHYRPGCLAYAHPRITKCNLVQPIVPRRGAPPSRWCPPQLLGPFHGGGLVYGGGALLARLRAGQCEAMPPPSGTFSGTPDFLGVGGSY